ncbi:MAG TPA: VOC family protein [Sporichthyaceae bacterium]|jgi:predicted 3-demethylubiquinone-9 3-methyltransferase (glyoxalase superfamily)
MPRITPCLWFDGNAEEAAAFYIKIFPNSGVTNVVRAPSGGTPSNEPGAVMVVEFSLDGASFVGLNGGPHFTFSEAISLQIPCADQAEVDYYWDALVDGGEPGPCGWLKDRFGLSWQVFPTRLMELNSDPDPERANRSMQAMMTMQKIDLAAIEAAVAGG